MARPTATRWYAALATLIVFVLLAWVLGAVLPLTEGERTVLRVGLLTLGLIAAAALLWFLRPDAQDGALPFGEGEHRAQHPGEEDEDDQRGERGVPARRGGAGHRWRREGGPGRRRAVR